MTNVDFGPLLAHDARGGQHEDELSEVDGCADAEEGGGGVPDRVVVEHAEERPEQRWLTIGSLSFPLRCSVVLVNLVFNGKYDLCSVVHQVVPYVLLTLKQ